MKSAGDMLSCKKKKCLILHLKDKIYFITFLRLVNLR